MACPEVLAGALGIKPFERAEAGAGAVLCRTACGSCRYIQPGFAKLCRNSGDHHAAVLFLKHNIIDECAPASTCALLPISLHLSFRHTAVARSQGTRSSSH